LTKTSNSGGILFACISVILVNPISSIALKVAAATRPSNERNATSVRIDEDIAGSTKVVDFCCKSSESMF